MSIQKNKYTSKKTGKTKITYYANVWYAAEKRSITGPMRNTEKQARQDETDIQRTIEAGKAKANSRKRKMEIEQIYKEWHEASRPPVYANSTWQIYAEYYERYINPVFGDRSVESVTAMHVQKYVNLMSEKYSAETVNKCLNILVDIFDFSVNVLKCIPENPAATIQHCKVSRKKKTIWTDAQIEYFLSLPNVQKSSYYPMLCLSAVLGARPGEICGLTEDCLFDSPCYSICIDTGYDNYNYETDLKTGNSHRMTPIPKYLYDLLLERLRQKQNLQEEIPGWGHNHFLFVGLKGNPITPKQYARAFKRLISSHNKAVEQIQAKTGELPEDMQILPHIALYGLRTSFATNNMRKNPNAALISSIMGNSPKTLIQFYTQSDVDMQSSMINDYINFNGSKMLNSANEN